jgi:hypothetical protein
MNTVALFLHLAKDHPVQVFIALGFAYWLWQSAVRPDLG